jgi:predicted ATPase
MRGWDLVEQGQGEEGIRQMRQGITDFLATGAKLAGPGLLARLAAAYGKVGQAEEGLRVVTQAMEWVETTGARVYEADLHQLKGELILQSESQSPKSAPREAEACFQKAIAVARRQSAKSLELRAATSLARLWQQQGKQRAAHALLVEIYSWFTEGFDTKDRQEAKALLEALT